jgi:uncharacterized membrane protein
VTLLILQAIFLGLGALLIFLIAKRALDDSWALLIGFVYLIYPGLIFANLYEFHPPVFAVTFLLSMLYFYLRQRFLLMTIFSVLALLCQENIALILCVFFIYALLSRRTSGKRYIIGALFLCSFLWFLSCIYLIMPFFAKEDMLYFKLFYSHIGGGPKAILSFFFTHPLKTLGILFEGHKIQYLVDLFGPLCFLSLAGSEFLFAILPAFLQHLLSLRYTEQIISLHYALEMIPFIFVAAIFGIQRLNRFTWFKFRRNLLMTIVFIVAIFFYVNTGACYYLYDLKNYKNNYYQQKQNLIEVIPPDAAVIATFCFQPKLSLRKYLYSFHNVLLSSQPYSKKKFILPRQTQFALIDFNDRLTFYGLCLRGGEERIQKFLTDTNWGIQDIQDSIVLFRKGLASDRYLYKILSVPEEPQTALDITIDNDFKLYGLNLITGQSGQSVSFELFWQAIRDVDKDIAVFFDFVDADGKIRSRIFSPICYRILPTYSWQNQMRIKEYRNIIFPVRLAKGKYNIKMGFCYYGIPLAPPLHSSQAVIDNLGRISIMSIVK